MGKKVLSIYFNTFILGLPIVVILTLLLFLVVTRLDVLYDAALFIPRKLGLTVEVSPDEIFELNTSDENIVYLEEGRYRIYSNRQLAQVANLSLLSQENFSRTNIPSLYTGRSIGADEPQFFFTVENSGYYEIITSGGSRAEDLTFRIEPYFGNQNAFIAIISAIVQLSILIIGIRLIYLYVKKDEIQKLKESQARKRQEWDTVLDELKNKEN